MQDEQRAVEACLLPARCPTRSGRADAARFAVTVMDPVNLALPFDTIDEGAVRTYRIVLPFLPPSKNVYDGWPIAWKSGAKKKWLKAIARSCAEQQVPLNMPKVGLAARLVFPTTARRDPQNYAQTLWHWVPDALVRCGVLVDDNDGRIEIGPNWGLTMEADLRPGKPKQRRQRTVLTLAFRSPRMKETNDGSN